MKPYFPVPLTNLPKYACNEKYALKSNYVLLSEYVLS